jgi:hypothetical protein
MRTWVLPLAVLVAVAGPAWAESKDKAPSARTAPLPDNRRDPEDRGESASTGASADRGAPEGVRGAPTDLGKDAEKEEDAYRKPQATKPKVRNLR